MATADFLLSFVSIASQDCGLPLSTEPSMSFTRYDAQMSTGTRKRRNMRFSELHDQGGNGFLENRRLFRSTRILEHSRQDD